MRWYVLMLFTLGACVQPATEVVVDLGSDIPSSDSLNLVVAVSHAHGSSSPEARVFTRAADGSGGLVFPSSFAVVPGAGEPHDDTVTLTLDLTATPSSPSEPLLVIHREARFAFTPGATTHLPIFLAQTCGQPAVGCTGGTAEPCTASVYCSDRGQTCGNDGSCVDIVTNTVGPGDAATCDRCDAVVTDVHAGDANLDATSDAQPDAAADATVDAPVDVPASDGCSRNCSGRVCGSDGCGGSCGSCASGHSCNASGQCVCVPDCAGRSCGSNGCGGNCGTCGSGQTCSGSGQCVCASNCSGRNCGSDGCGGSCGSCASGQSCNGSGQCVCAPSCAGRVCGPDSCGGGSCGTCPTNYMCNGSGQCVCSFPCGTVCCDVATVLYCGHTNPNSCCYTCGAGNCPLC